MKLGTRRYEDVIILQFIGELGSQHLPPLKRRLDGLLEGGDLKFVLDSKQLSFVNSAGLGYLIRFAKEAKRYGGEIVLAAPSQFLRDTLITLKITDFFPTYDSIREGVLHFRKGADVNELDLRGIAAADPPPLEVPVEFRARDDTAERSKELSGRIVNVREDSLLFRFGPLPGGDYGSLHLEPGNVLHLKFSQPFVVKDYVFEFDGEIQQVNRLEEGDLDHGVSVRVAYADIKDEDRRHLGQFARDQALWKAARDPV